MQPVISKQPAKVNGARMLFSYLLSAVQGIYLGVLFFLGYHITSTLNWIDETLTTTGDASGGGFVLMASVVVLYISSAVAAVGVIIHFFLRKKLALLRWQRLLLITTTVALLIVLVLSVGVEYRFGPWA